MLETIRFSTGVVYNYYSKHTGLSLWVIHAVVPNINKKFAVC